jgi:hypothetical protein
MKCSYLVVFVGIERSSRFFQHHIDRNDFILSPISYHYTGGRLPPLQPPMVSQFHRQARCRQTRTTIVHLSSALVIFAILFSLSTPLVGGAILSGTPSAAVGDGSATTSSVVGSALPPFSSAHGSRLLAHRSGHAIQATPQNTTSSQSNTSSHRLVIRGLDQRATYSVQANGTVSTRKTERTDASRTSIVTGLVGPNDSIDIITFTGHITTFSTDGGLRVTVDGRSVNPTVLDGHYIQFEPTRQSSTPVNYTFTVNGSTEPTQLAEPTDSPPSPNTSRVTGTLTGTDIDAFYYTGNITNSTVSGPLTVTIDGQVVPVNSAGTPTPSPSPRGTTTPPPNATQESTTSRSPTTTPVIDTTLPFQVSNLSVRPSTAEVNTEVTVTVRVENTGNARVDAPLKLATGGTIVSSQQVTLFPGEWQRVTFTHEYENPGHYTIRVGQLHEQVSIVAEGNLKQQQGTNSDTLSFWILVIGAIGTGLTLVWIRLR